MTDNSESTFQPHSDEELARLLEEQMRAMRSAQPITSPQPIAAFTPEPAVVDNGTEDLGIDDLFGALLEDTTDIPVVQAEVEEVLFVPSVDESTLEHTQPITYIQEDVVEVAVIDEHIVVEETIVEAVIEDAHVIAERVLSEITVDGEIVATTISETAGADPIPQMFGEVVVEATIAVEEAPIAFPEPVPASSLGYVSDVVIEDNTVEFISEEVTVVDEVELPQIRMSNPINSFAPRPTFDELVFGVKSDD